MRIEAQEGFVTNSSSTTYCDVVIGATFEDFLTWVRNVANLEPEDLMHKNIFKYTLEEFSTEIDYSVGEFVLDIINIERMDLGEREAQFAESIKEKDYFSEDKDKVWISSYVKYDREKKEHVWSHFPKKLQKFYAKMVKAFYITAEEHFTCGSHSLRDVECNNTKTNCLGNLTIIYDSDFEETVAMHMLMALSVFARESNLVQIGMSEHC